MEFVTLKNKTISQLIDTPLLDEGTTSRRISIRTININI